MELEAVQVIAESERLKFGTDMGLSLIGIKIRGGKVRLVARCMSPVGTSRILEACFLMQYSTSIECAEGVDRRAGQEQLKWIEEQLASEGFSPAGMGAHWYSYQAWRPYLPVNDMYGDAGLATVNAVLEQYPHQPHALAMRSAAHWHYHDFDAAIADASRAIAQAPTYSDAYFHRGKSHVPLEHWQQADDDFSKAISLDPDNFTYLHYRASLRLVWLEGDPKAALPDVDRLVELRPRDPTHLKWQQDLHAQVKGKK